MFELEALDGQSKALPTLSKDSYYSLVSTKNLSQKLALEVGT